ncbi:DUF3263 domain-containing protein [Mycobacterium sp. SMC-4]|uniref:DUF3263 domain-containing protein n=1 Tax=Mycobacterium sp. SMC-4 TaxID=2857059 RepID=UPI0021B3D9F6|nr:DUF3263 domain-containing protein [Mycobacterium sp. SMC-4]UXA19488.1 DUF3263 domain-containing protein [Mycobacterium sp. SMC-4]
MALDTLTDLERAMLDLEQQWWATAAGKEDGIRALGLSPTRYYQLLGRLLATEKAVAYAAVSVNRLRRIALSRENRRPGYETIGTS